MEFVTQLWAYKSERFVLGVPCPELVKNHVWLLLILLKCLIVGCSVTHLSQPHIFNPYFDHLNSPVSMQSESGSVYYLFKSECKEDKNLNKQLHMYYYFQGATLLFLFITYLRILLSGVPLIKGQHSSRSKKSSYNGSSNEMS